ncbi:NAD(P)H-dependent oxidoreductase [Myroides sp. 1354]|uniref:Atu1372/SO_1960 family protein n=1 Tax=unclassified Myroides TaxID=2642485 RepID=UPI0025767609|nr:MULTISPECIES: Atu1372/SO_1960 family protein [unclassified Myroides]MDM1046214.1 NAD(P)H-dependent oxidoreductase [Myroides sp. R163-1]MDM1057150.1 NAD(P)H-dependent oxidoreductase [Myroides sp. 1354]MDM1070345.1 NAD(P)H-dependent oxidoreductase [Myroides sp. 1372]
MKQITIFIFALVLILNTQQSMAQEKTTHILVLIDSDQGGTYTLAKEIAQGVERWPGAKATIKKVKESNHPSLAAVPLVEVTELPTYDGIAFGSPVYFGNISTGMSAFFAQTIDLWSARALEEKPATVFMAGGSGAANELALQSFWNTLAVHGMVLVPNGIQGFDTIDQTKTTGNSVLGITSPMSINKGERPTADERKLAQNQGEKLARVASGLKGSKKTESTIKSKASVEHIDLNQVLKDKNIELPQLPKPVGNYELYVRTGNLVFINQVALKDGKIFNPGKLGVDVNEEQVKEATKVTMLNVLAILRDAVGGDLNKVQRCVQLIGAFNTVDTYTQHAVLMNPASDLVVEVLGEKGKHTRNTGGASSLPLGSSVSIQAIFEVE